MADEKAVVAALQLLLSDYGDHERFMLFRIAFRDQLVLFDNIEVNRLENRLADASLLCDELQGSIDGSSGLGAAAARNASVLVRRLHGVVQSISKQVLTNPRTS